MCPTPLRSLIISKDLGTWRNSYCAITRRWTAPVIPGEFREARSPLESRIIAVADVFEALVGERPYRASINRHSAVKEMQEMPLDREGLAILIENLVDICRLITYRKRFPVTRALIIRTGPKKTG